MPVPLFRDRSAAALARRRNAALSRRSVRKLLIIDRLEAAGLFAAAMAALGGPGALAYERWSAATEIARDDARVRALLAAIGADPDAILSPEA